MYTKNNLLINYRLIANFVNSRKPVSIQADNPDYFTYSTKHLFLAKKYSNVMTNKALSLAVYLAAIKELVYELSSLRIEDPVIKEMIQLDILRFISVILLNAIGLITNNDVQAREIKEIRGYQINVEERIQQNFDATFFLPNPFTLAKISKEYNEAYETDYGQGCIGFFKLPIKRFFQQKTREEELKFLEDVEYYCTTNLLPDEQKKQLKLSAANLVLQAISSETFGKGSQLSKILTMRMNQSDNLGDRNFLMDTFISECEDRNIGVPAHLKEHFKQKFDKNQTTIPQI